MSAPIIATAAAPAPAPIIAGPLRTVGIALPRASPQPGTEIPPEVLPGDGGGPATLYVSTDSTWRCRAPLGLAPARVGCDAPGRLSFALGGDALFRAPEVMPPGREHRRSYLNVFGAAAVRDAAGRRHVVTADHGEDKNVARDGRVYENTVYLGRDALAPPRGSCVSGLAPSGVYADCGAAYSAFVSTAVIDGDGPPRDLGPAVWPVAGYATADRLRRLGHGVRHPAIADGGDGFLYLLYVDTGDATGAGAGVRVARSPVAALGRGWSTWVAAEGRWVAALPLGAGAASSTGALPAGSPARSAPLFASTTPTFSVARMDGAAGWLGVEQPPDLARTCVTAQGATDHPIATYLRTSPDLVRWSARIPVSGPGLTACGFADLQTGYARLLRADGRSTKDLDPARFAIVGTHTGGTVNVVGVAAPWLAWRMLPRPTIGR